LKTIFWRIGMTARAMCLREAETHLRRCRNPKHISWRNYGGRGIEVRFKSFEEFFADVGLRSR
jgi:hypothetical protein